MPRALTDVQPGDRVRITCMCSGPGASAIRQRLLDMGITRGSELLVERVAPLGDPVEILVKGYHLAIRKSEASLIHIDDAEPR